MDLALGVVLGIGIAAALAAVWRAVRGPRMRGIPEEAMQAALHAATATLPHLRKGLNSRNAEQGGAAPPCADRRGRDRACGPARRARDRRRGARAGAAGRSPLEPARAGPRRPPAHRPPAGVLGSKLPAAVSRAGAAGRAGQAYRHADRLLPVGRAPQPSRAACRPGSRQPRLRAGRAVTRGGAGGAPGTGGAAGAASPDLAPLHLQRARRRRRRHPRPPGGGARSADRLRRVHPLPVPRWPLVRDARRGDRARGALPPARAGAVPGEPERHDRRARGHARHGGPGDVRPAAGRERGPPRGRARRRHGTGDDPRRDRRRGRRAARHRRRRRDRARAPRGGARRGRRRNRGVQRRRPAPRDVRRAVRAADRIRPR